jgi:hypothetical protein
MGLGIGKGWREGVEESAAAAMKSENSYWLAEHGLKGTI